MGQIISVVSGKGGVGKSTVAAGIGRCLVQAGCRVLLIDTDCGLCAAEFLLENGGSGVYTLEDVLQGHTSLDSVVVTGLDAGLPDFVPAPEHIQALQDTAGIADCIQQFASMYDYVLLDRPAGFHLALEEALTQCRGLVVCQPESMSLRGAKRVCDELRSADCQPIHVIVNRFRSGKVQDKTLPNLDTVCDSVGAGLLGIVPEDKQVLIDQAKGEFSVRSPYGKAINRIAARLMGQSVLLPKLKKIMK